MMVTMCNYDPVADMEWAVNTVTVYDDPMADMERVVNTELKIVGD